MTNYVEEKQDLSRTVFQRRTQKGVGCTYPLLGFLSYFAGLGGIFHGMRVENEYEILTGLSLGILGVYMTFANARNSQRNQRLKIEKERNEREILEHGLRISNYKEMIKDHGDLEDRVSYLEKHKKSVKKSD